MMTCALRSPTSKAVIKRLERGVLAPFAIAGGILGGVAVGQLFNDPSFPHFDQIDLMAIGIVTGLLTLLALRLALLPSSPRAVVVCTIGTCLCFAVLNAPLSFFVVSSLGGPSQAYEALRMVPVVAVFGVVFAAPLGLMWATAFVRPMFVVAKLRREPTLDGPDRAVRSVGGTLAVTCGLGGLVGLSVGFMPEVLFAMSALGTVAVLVSTVRLHILSRFLRRVRRGVVDGWVIVARDDLDDVPDGLPRTDPRGDPGGVLVREVRGKDAGAYRTGGVTRIPWARTQL